MPRRPRSRSDARPDRPFDSTTKFLFDLDPAAWLTYAGFRVDAPVQVLDTDLATIQARVDKVCRIDNDPPWLAHLEFQASADPEMIDRLLEYNVRLHRRHGTLVETILVLLRPSADARELTGRFQQLRADGSAQLQFHYTVVRVWEQDVEQVLAGDLAWLPLATLTRVSDDQLPTILRRIDARLAREVSPSQAGELWTATYWLAGLRYNPEVSAPLFQGVRAVRESTTYQAAVAEGRAEGEARGEARGRADEARRLLLLVAGQRFGPPSARARRTLAGLSNVERLERITARLLQASDWDDLLATP